MSYYPLMAKAKLAVLIASNISLTASDHPNRMSFKGILVRLDEPSTKPPSGARGHRIHVSSSVAKRRLKTLIGMGLNYSKSLDRHEQTRKVGTIENAWIDGKDLWVEGVVWKHDFPDSERDLKKPNLGMSMEIGQVQVEDENASIWKLSDFYFLGATILDRDAAAYVKTRAMAAKAEGSSKMTSTKKKDTTKGAEPDVVTIAATAAAQAAAQTLLPTLNRQTKILAGMAIRLDELQATRTRTVEADVDDVDAEEDDIDADSDIDADEDVDAAKKDDDGDEDDMDAEEINKGDLEDLGPKLGDEGSAPGGQNKGINEHKGHKTTSQNKVGKTVSSARLNAALQRFETLSAEFEDLKTKYASLAKKYKTQKAQAELAASKVTRRSVVSIDATTSHLLAKGGIDVGDLAASGQKLTVAEVDAVLSAGLDLPIVKRMEVKNRLIQAGLMDDGAVVRHHR